ncbi:YphA family membrane protein [Paenibacillus ferrarius]|uniref:YphA family membrane protein n=1 Tax=Paenibacillus ferrarius TaxID=1469647 RepID=UPI003D28F561
MNSGYLSFILMSITLILLASGWKTLYVGGVSHQRLLLFFASWIVSARLTVTVENVHVRLVYALIAALSFLILYRTQGIVHKVHLLSIGLLLGSLHFLLQQLLEMDPILIIRNPAWESAAIIAVVAVAVQRNCWEQFAAISLGYVIGDLYQAGIREIDGYHRLGYAAFQDQWWLSIFLARTLTIVLQAAYAGCRSLVRSLFERNGGR